MFFFPGQTASGAERTKEPQRQAEGLGADGRERDGAAVMPGWQSEPERDKRGRLSPAPNVCACHTKSWNF